MPSPSPTARRIGPFRLLSVLGRGGMGTVHLAEHEAFGTRVALKCLRDDDPDARQLFLEEARAMCRLDHRHIARIFDHGVHEETPWFAMELAQSTLLAEAQLTPSWRSLSTSARQLLDALAHAHARGVVHRDLKPSNVLVATHDDLRPGVKLVDFGIAASSAQSPSRAGTPEYMAPEQWSGDLSAVGPWTDIYAVGNLFWALCCGRPPVQEDDMVATWGRQGRNDLDPFEPQFHVPSELEGWLRTCLRAYPGERFASVPDALKALDLAEGGPRAVRRVAARVAAADAPTVRNPTDTLDLEQTMTDERPLRARRRPSSAPIPESFDDVDMPAAPTHVAGTGLGALPWRQAPLVGRGREQQALWRTLRAVEADRHPRVVRLSGAPGVGRTALGTWLIQQVRANSGARAVRVTEAAGLQGLVDALLQPYGAPRDTSARERGLLRFDADDPASLDALSGLALVEEGPRAAGMVLDVLAALARLHTVVVFLDASPKATGLQALAERWAELPGPALLVVTDIDSPGATELRVPSLRPMAVAQAATSLLPLHPSLVRELADRAGGLPRRAPRHARPRRPRPAPRPPGLRAAPRAHRGGR